MVDSELLSEVKTALGIGGTYQDNTLKIYINETKEYLRDAGVSDSIIDSESAIGIITRGVSDLWNYGQDNAQLSQYFKERAIQLVYRSRKEVS